MEISSNCASCQNLSTTLQKLHSKFAIYKQKCNQNDELIDTFSKQNKYLKILKEELCAKDSALTEACNKLKCSEIECVGLRHTLEKERGDKEKELAAKFKHAEKELQVLRENLETALTDLAAEKKTNTLLRDKLEDEISERSDDKEKSALEKKELLNKVSIAEAKLAKMNRRLRKWACMKDTKKKLLKSVLTWIKKCEKSKEGALLEANLDSESPSKAMQNGFTSESDVSPVRTPSKEKSVDIMYATDSSEEEEFEEVTEDKKTKSPKKKSPCKTRKDCFNKIEATSRMKSINELHKSRRKTDLKTPSPKKPVKKCTRSPNTCEKENVENSQVLPASLDVLLDTNSDVITDVDDELKEKELIEYRCIASILESPTYREGVISPLPGVKPQDCAEAYTTVNKCVKDCGDVSTSCAFCVVCTKLVSQCTVCIDSVRQFNDWKYNNIGTQKLEDLPPKEELEEYSAARSLFSPMPADNLDVTDSDDLSADDSPLTLKETTVSLNKKEAGVQTLMSNIRTWNFGTQTNVTRKFDRAVQTDLLEKRASNETRSKSDNAPAPVVAQSVEDTRNKRIQVLVENTTHFKGAAVHTERGTNCVQDSNSVASQTDPTVPSGGDVNTCSMKDFFQSSLLNLINQSNFYPGCGSAFSGFGAIPTLQPVFASPALCPTGMYCNSMCTRVYGSDGCIGPRLMPNVSVQHRCNTSVSRHRPNIPKFKKEDAPENVSSAENVEPSSSSCRNKHEVRRRNHLSRMRIQMGITDCDSEVQITPVGSKRKLMVSSPLSEQRSSKRKNLRKKAKESSRRSGRSRNRSLSESSSSSTESVSKKRYSRINRICDSSSDSSARENSRPSLESNVKSTSQLLAGSSPAESSYPLEGKLLSRPEDLASTSGGTPKLGEEPSARSNWKLPDILKEQTCAFSSQALTSTIDRASLGETPVAAVSEDASESKPNPAFGGVPQGFSKQTLSPFFSAAKPVRGSASVATGYAPASNSVRQKLQAEVFGGHPSTLYKARKNNLIESTSLESTRTSPQKRPKICDQAEIKSSQSSKKRNKKGSEAPIDDLIEPNAPDITLVSPQRKQMIRKEPNQMSSRSTEHINKKHEDPDQFSKKKFQREMLAVNFVEGGVAVSSKTCNYVEKLCAQTIEKKTASTENFVQSLHVRNDVIVNEASMNFKERGLSTEVTKALNSPSKDIDRRLSFLEDDLCLSEDSDEDTMTKPASPRSRFKKGLKTPERMGKGDSSLYEPGKEVSKLGDLENPSRSVFSVEEITTNKRDCATALKKDEVLIPERTVFDTESIEPFLDSVLLKEGLPRMHIQENHSVSVELENKTLNTCMKISTGDETGHSDSEAWLSSKNEDGSQEADAQICAIIGNEGKEVLGNDEVAVKKKVQSEEEVETNEVQSVGGRDSVQIRNSHELRSGNKFQTAVSVNDENILQATGTFSEGNKDQLSCSDKNELRLVEEVQDVGKIVKENDAVKELREESGIQLSEKAFSEENEDQLSCSDNSELILTEEVQGVGKIVKENEAVEELSEDSGIQPLEKAVSEENEDQLNCSEKNELGLTEKVLDLGKIVKENEAVKELSEESGIQLLEKAVSVENEDQLSCSDNNELILTAKVQGVGKIVKENEAVEELSEESGIQPLEKAVSEENEDQLNCSEKNVLGLTEKVLDLGKIVKENVAVKELNEESGIQLSEKAVNEENEDQLSCSGKNVLRLAEEVQGVGKIVKEDEAVKELSEESGIQFSEKAAVDNDVQKRCKTEQVCSGRAEAAEQNNVVLSEASEFSLLHEVISLEKCAENDDDTLFEEFPNSCEDRAIDEALLFGDLHQVEKKSINDSMSERSCSERDKLFSDVPGADEGLSEILPDLKDYSSDDLEMEIVVSEMGEEISEKIGSPANSVEKSSLKVDSQSLILGKIALTALEEASLTSDNASTRRTAVRLTPEASSVTSETAAPSLKAPVEAVPSTSEAPSKTIQTPAMTSEELPPTLEPNPLSLKAPVSKAPVITVQTHSPMLEAIEVETSKSERHPQGKVGASLPRTPRLPVCPVSLGPYNTRRSKRKADEINEDLKIVPSTNSALKSIAPRETAPKAVRTSTRRSRTSVPPEKLRIISKELVSSESISDSDSEKLIVAEETDEVPSEVLEDSGESSNRGSLNGSDVGVSNDKSSLNVSSVSSDSTNMDVSSESLPVDEEDTNFHEIQPTHNLRPRSRTNSRSTQDQVKPHRRSLRNLSATKMSSAKRKREEIGGDYPGQENVVAKSECANNSGRMSKLQKLRSSISKVHPLVQKVRAAPVPRAHEELVKKIKSEKSIDELLCEFRKKGVIRSEMPRSGRTAVQLEEEPGGSVIRKKRKDTSKPVPKLPPAPVIVKPKMSPQERRAAAAAIMKARVLSQEEKSGIEASQKMPGGEKVQSVNCKRDEPSSKEGKSTFKRSNTLKQMSSRFEAPDLSEATLYNSPFSTYPSPISDAAVPSNSPTVTDRCFSPRSVALVPSISPLHSFDTTFQPPTATSFNIQTLNSTTSSNLQPLTATLTRLPLPTNLETNTSPTSPLADNEVISGHRLIQVINSTQRSESYSKEIVQDDCHPLVAAWKKREDRRKIRLMVKQSSQDEIKSSANAVKKITNRYLGSGYFTEELLNTTVSALLDPKYSCVPLILARTVVNIVDDDHDSKPCPGIPEPGCFLTKLQQQLIALVMRLLPKFPNIVNDIIILIEHKLYRLPSGRFNRSGDLHMRSRLEWLAGLHTAFCRILKWRAVSLIFCFDALYCFVTRFDVILNTVFKIWPQLLPNSFNGSSPSTFAEVLFHFVMTQGKMEKNPDLKQLRETFVRRRLYSGNTNAQELTERVIQQIKDGASGYISPALILISKRQGFPWAENEVVNKHLLLMVRDWLISNEPAAKPLPVAVISTLCAIVRAFSGEQHAVKATYEVMKSLLLDTPEDLKTPSLEHAVCAGLLYLIRLNIGYVVELLKKWQPKNEVPVWLLDLFRSMMESTAWPPSQWYAVIGLLLQSTQTFTS